MGHETHAASAFDAGPRLASTLGLSKQVFISYSRREFHFAESLALLLQARGVNAWFDSQRLEPGSDWDRAIMDALHGSAALVLVASRASLASPHVEAEWKAAKDAGIPIHVVLAEPVALPPDLPYSSIHDLRIRFDEGVRRLAQTIAWSRVPAAPPSYTTGRTSLGFLSPIKRTPVVSFTWFALLATTLISLLLGAAVLLGALTWDVDAVRSNVRANPMRVFAWVAPWAGFTVLAAYLWWSFARRRFRLPVLVLWLVFAPLVLGVLEVGAEDLFDYLRHGDVTVVVEDSASDYLSGPFAVSLLLLIVVSWRLAFVVHKSPNMYRWLPTGEAYEVARTQHAATLGQRRQSSSAAVPGSSRIYSLHYDGAADAGVAAAVEAAMASFEHRRSDVTDELDEHIVVVSSDTGRDWLRERLGSLRGRVVCVIGTGLHVPAKVERLNELQWFDYRDRSQQKLAALGRSFATPAGRAAASPGVLPERLDKLSLPGPVRFLALSFFLLGAIGTGYVLSGTLSAVRGFAPALDVLFANAASALLFLALALLVTFRKLTRRLFLAIFALACGAFYLSGGPVAGLVDPGLSALDPWLALALPSCVLLLGGGLKAIWFWLPSAREPRRGIATMASPPIPRFWPAFAVIIALAETARLHVG
jgi:hypothetical protein